jgi:hypothetical protein
MANTDEMVTLLNNLFSTFTIYADDLNSKLNLPEEEVSNFEKDNPNLVIGSDNRITTFGLINTILSFYDHRLIFRIDEEDNRIVGVSLQ